MFLVEKANLSSHFRSATKKPPHVPKPYQLAARLFDEKVNLHLKTLDLTQNLSNISLSWLSTAASVLSKLHTVAEDHISNLKPEADEYGFQTLYMDYSLKVLDLCNLISSAVRQLTDRRLLINFSLRLLNFTDQNHQILSNEKLNKAKDALTRSVKNTQIPAKEKGFRAKVLLEELSVLIGKLPRGTHGKTSNGRDRDLICRTFYTLGSLTLFIGAVMVAALFGDTETVNLLAPTESTQLTDEFVWFDSIRIVQSKIFDLLKLKKNAVLEVDDVLSKAVAVRDLVEGIMCDDGGVDGEISVRLVAGVKELALAVKMFSDGVDSLTNGVNGLFSTVLKTRNGL